MDQNTLDQSLNKPSGRKQVVKEAILQLLREALAQEEYESCPKLITAAKECGIGQAEIRLLLAKHVRGMKGKSPREERTTRRF